MRQITISFDDEVSIGPLMAAAAATYEKQTGRRASVLEGRGSWVNGVPEGHILVYHQENHK